MKKLIAATTIATLSLVGFAGAASADGADGTCWQPGSNPPLVVDCDSPAATTPYVPTPTTITTTPYVPTIGTPEHPFPNGTCWQPGSSPPRLVNCNGPDATTPYVPTPTTIADTAPPTNTAVVVVAATDPAVAPSVSSASPAPRIVMSHSLPATGASSMLAIVIGAVAVLAGGLLVLTTRRA